jgi:hypothetical protein
MFRELDMKVLTGATREEHLVMVFAVFGCALDIAGHTWDPGRVFQPERADRLAHSNLIVLCKLRGNRLLPQTITTHSAW